MQQHPQVPLQHQYQQHLLHQQQRPPPWQRHPQGAFSPGPPRWDQQGTRGRRGGGRGRGPGRHYGGPSRSPICGDDVQIPYNALSDPWEALNGKNGGPCPPEGPTEEIMEALRAAVAREQKLHQLLVKMGAPLCAAEEETDSASTIEEATEGPLNRAEAAAQQHQQQQQQQPQVLQVEQPNDDTDVSKATGAPSGGDPALGAEGGPPVMRHRCPLILPPPSFSCDAFPTAAEDPEGAEPLGSDPLGSKPLGPDPVGSGPPGSDPRGSDPQGSDPPGSGSDLCIRLGAPGGPPRPFTLPAVTKGAASGGPSGGPLDGGGILRLDEEEIRKRLRTQK
ncbi:hypothetical protein, conserved [Eimeria maxima]|uniref:Uncharacterized protein n=1 Tax=Eimeria maxima TaxID=5804 RepID=U6MDM4_EIMMA|nr:hypothetical protein, conserved [Eimeria maxima]CDJ60529.1 hypothetical protein, conserved [Eimeria maxima]